MIKMSDKSICISEKGKKAEGKKGKKIKGSERYRKL